MLSREIIARVRVIYVTVSLLLNGNNLWTPDESTGVPEGFTEVFVQDDADNFIADGFAITALVKGDEVIYRRQGGFAGVQEKSQSLSLELGKQNLAKKAWPELLGVDKFSAKKAILLDGVRQVFVVFEGDAVIRDFRADRVWIWVSRTTNKVIKVPRIG
eukprot:TRINITY_DN20475_c0_g1_i1.p1 TRINITY_DN20475_c0_g1~~TRINITY_DN20475_c0_g1_i1.p1  ORF type:complete len:159 (-),score=26.15 TRINITY_DN20475_c0_g1_i1:92-568(-)